MNDASVSEGVVREFTASDGYVFRYRHWRRAEAPKLYLVSLHGIQSHSGWYSWSSSRLAAAGCDVRFLDRRGSGLCETDRGDTVSAQRLITDVAEYLQFVADDRQAETNQTPILLGAVSWGGKLAAAVAAEHPDLIDGLALMYPAIRTMFEPRWWQRLALRATTRAGLGSRLVRIPLDEPRLFTDDPQWQTFIRDDPLTLRKVSVSFLETTLDLTRAAVAAATQIRCPTWVALAGRDRIVDTPAMRRWAAGLPRETTRLIEYPHARHTLEFDACRDQFITDLIEWTEQIKCL